MPYITPALGRTAAYFRRTATFTVVDGSGKAVAGPFTSADEAQDSLMDLIAQGGQGFTIQDDAPSPGDPVSETQPQPVDPAPTDPAEDPQAMAPQARRKTAASPPKGTKGTCPVCGEDTTMEIPEWGDLGWTHGDNLDGHNFGKSHACKTAEMGGRFYIWNGTTEVAGPYDSFFAASNALDSSVLGGGDLHDAVNEKHNFFVGDEAGKPFQDTNINNTSSRQGAPSMTVAAARQREATLLKAMAHASLDEGERMVKEIESIRRYVAKATQDDTALDFSSEMVRAVTSAKRPWERNTGETDWLLKSASFQGETANKVLAEASMWFSRTPMEVTADRDEFSQQAIGMARRVAAPYDENRATAERAFLDHVGFLRRRVIAGETLPWDQKGKAAPSGDGNPQGPDPDDETGEAYSQLPRPDVLDQAFDTFPFDDGTDNQTRRVSKQSRRVVAEGGSTCKDCGNDIVQEEDSTGQRGLAWTEYPSAPDGDDRGFQCGMSEDGLHHPNEAHTSRRKQSRRVVAEAHVTKGPDGYACSAGCPVVLNDKDDAKYHEQWHRDEDTREALPGKGYESSRKQNKQAGISTQVSKIPPCDICGNGTPAAYDARLPAYGNSWGNVCQQHFDAYGPGTLGTGHGQKLIAAPKPDEGKTAARRQYGDRAECRDCGGDIAWHGKDGGWRDRGGNTTHDERQSGKRDEDGILVPGPAGKHRPYLGTKKAMRRVAVAYTRQHFNHIADTIASFPNDEHRDAIAHHFAGFLGSTNPGFKSDRFVAAATGKPSTSDKSAKMTAGHYRGIADAISRYPDEGVKAQLGGHFAQSLKRTNPAFSSDRFLDAAAGKPQSGRDVHKGSRRHAGSGRPCEWFAKCTNEADRTRPHPILGAVPICGRCDAKMDQISGDRGKPRKAGYVVAYQPTEADRKQPMVVRGTAIRPRVPVRVLGSLNRSTDPQGRFAVVADARGNYQAVEKASLFRLAGSGPGGTNPRSDPNGDSVKSPIRQSVPVADSTEQAFPWTIENGDSTRDPGTAETGPSGANDVANVSTPGKDGYPNTTARRVRAGDFADAQKESDGFLQAAHEWGHSHSSGGIHDPDAALRQMGIDPGDGAYESLKDAYERGHTAHKNVRRLTADDDGGRQSYEDWMAKVDAAVQKRVGLSVHDLADIPFRDLYDDGVSPSSAAGKAISAEGSRRIIAAAADDDGAYPNDATTDTQSDSEYLQEWDDSDNEAPENPVDERSPDSVSDAEIGVRSDDSDFDREPVTSGYKSAWNDDGSQPEAKPGSEPMTLFSRRSRHPFGKAAASHDPIAYTYEADTHCPGCAKDRFGTDEHGFVPEDAEDGEGNPVGAVAPWDETEPATSCGTCGGEITPDDDRYDHDNQTWTSSRRVRADQEVGGTATEFPIDNMSDKPASGEIGGVEGETGPGGPPPYHAAPAKPQAKDRWYVETARQAKFRAVVQRNLQRSK